MGYTHVQCNNYHGVSTRVCSQVALVDSQYQMVIRGVALKNMFSRVGLTTAVQWPNLRNVQTDKVGIIKLCSRCSFCVCMIISLM